MVLCESNIRRPNEPSNSGPLEACFASMIDFARLCLSWPDVKRTLFEFPGRFFSSLLSAFYSAVTTM